MMKKTLTTLASLLMVPLCCYAARHAAEVRLIDTIAVQAPHVALGEIATIEAENPLLKQQLIDLIITSAPSISNPKVISALKIRSSLEKAGFPDDIKVIGTQTLASLETRTVTDSEVIAILEEWVNKSIEDDTKSEIDYLRLPPRWKVPAGDGVRITIDSSRAKTEGTIVVTLRAVINDQVLATTHAKMHVSKFRNHAVLIRPLKRNEIITADHVEMRCVDITGLRGMEVASPKDVFGLAAKHNIGIGTVISVKDFEKPIVIERGSLNRIVVINNAIKVNISGAQALQSGKVGETILFANPMNRQEPLRARIVRAGLAVIELGCNKTRDY